MDVAVRASESETGTDRQKNALQRKTCLGADLANIGAQMDSHFRANYENEPKVREVEK